MDLVRYRYADRFRVIVINIDRPLVLNLILFLSC